MPVPKGYTLATQSPDPTSQVPKGYTLETPATTSHVPAGFALDTSAGSTPDNLPTPGLTTGVAGLPAGETLPGFQAAPNPIASAKSTVGDYLFGVGKTPQSKRALATQQAAATEAHAMTNAPTTLHQSAQAAEQDVQSTAASLGHAASNWWDMPAGQKLGSVVMSPLTAAIGIGENIGEAGDQAVHGHPLDAATTLLGGDPAEAQRQAEAGNVGGAGWYGLGRPAVLTAGAEAAGGALGEAKNALRGERFANSNFSNLIAPGFKQGELPYEAAANLRPYYQQEAAAMGMKDENLIQKAFTGQTPTRNTWGGPTIPETVTGMQKVRDLADRVVDRIDSRINGPDGVMAQAENDPVPPQTKAKILADLEARKEEAKGLGASHANAYNPLIEQVQKADTFGKLNKIKQDANKMIEGVLNGKNPSEAAAASVEPVMAWKNAGNSIRENMYPDLQRYVAPQGTPGYFSIADSGRLEGQAMDARDGVYANYYSSGMANLPEISKKYLENVAEGSLYKTHVLRRALDLFPTPAGKFNKTFQRGLGSIGEGATPESLSVRPQQLKLPPPSTPAPVYPGRFELPTQAPTETVVGAPQSTPQQVYLGTHQVPNPDYNPIFAPPAPGEAGPIAAPSRFQQNRELGTTATTIPDRVRGPQTPSRVQADQIGVGHNPSPATGAQPRNYRGLNPPNSSFTGPETTTSSNWQYLTGSTEPPQMIARNGAAVLQTSDPEIAEMARKNMREFEGSKEYKALPENERKLHDDTLRKLDQQWSDYQKWKETNPVPPPPGAEPKFEVWLNPGFAGKVTAIRGKLARRALAHGTRMGIQGAVRKAGDANNQGRSMDETQAEEERMLASQPQ